MVTKTLWLVGLDLGYTHLLCPFYAVTEDEVKEKVADLELKNGSRCTSLQKFERGFRIVRTELPGTIEVEEAEQCIYT